MTQNYLKTIIITGAGRGIGRGLAFWFATKQMQVVIAEVNKQEGENTAEHIASLGGEAVFIETDVSSEQSVNNCVKKTVDLYGKVDGLINNAAISEQCSFLETSYDLWQKTLNINLTGVFLMSQAVTKWMVENSFRGKIVNIASINSFVAEVDSCAYVSSKGGVNMLTKAMAVDLAKHHINVNAIAPGAILTGHNKGYSKNEPSLTKYLLTDQIGSPDDIAATAEFLLSNESKYINGSTITVDGGYMAYARWK